MWSTSLPLRQTNHAAVCLKYKLTCHLPVFSHPSLIPSFSLPVPPIPLTFPSFFPAPLPFPITDKWYKGKVPHWGQWWISCNWIWRCTTKQLVHWIAGKANSPSYDKRNSFDQPPIPKSWEIYLPTQSLVQMSAALLRKRGQSDGRKCCVCAA